KTTALHSLHLQYGKESFVVANPTEETVTNGIIRVSGTTKKIVYFAEGDGEADIGNQNDPKGYAGAKLALEQENYEVRPLVLPSAEQIPDDASALVIAGVQRPLSEHEVQIVDAYLKRGGHLLALVGPRQGDERVPKLHDLGIEPPPAPEGKKAPDAARLVVFGTPMFADNQQLAEARLNGDLFLNAIGWLVGQEELVAIRSRTVRASRAELTREQAVQ